MTAGSSHQIATRQRRATISKNIHFQAPVLLDMSLSVADRLHANCPSFVCLDLRVDEEFDTSSFLDLTFSFRHNYTLQHLTVIRTPPNSTFDGSVGKQTEDPQPRSCNVLVARARRRSKKELRMLLVEIFKLRKLQTLDFITFRRRGMV